ncbi:hypothetical protein [Geodermatophilus sp. URMC 62]|uniref:hypothetical protein n=1 Tax=Geodermatophilus sp. URMC 62 TaxID=3423414 RepID=UPI00406C7B71
MTMNAPADRLHVLRERLHELGATAVPWEDVSHRVQQLRHMPPEAWATAGLAVDGYIAAAEDAWPVEITDALQRLGWADRWDPRALRFLVTPIDGAAAAGFRNSVKGTVFEQMVEDRAEEGLLDLPEGADGLELAKSLNQPGWDAELLRDDEVVGVVQMKATGSLDYLMEHVERYPDVEHVIATSEVAAAAQAKGMDVIDGGVRNDDLTAMLTEAGESLDAGSLVHEWIPVTGLSLVVLRAVRAHGDGASFDQLKDILAEEGITLVAAHAAGLVIETTTGLVGLRLVTSLGVRLGRRRYLVQQKAREELQRQRSLTAVLAERARACGAAS